MAETEKEFDFIELATALGEEKKLFLSIPILAVLITAIVSFFLTPIYVARTVIMPPQQQQQNTSVNAMLDQLGPLAGAAAGAAGIKNLGEMYLFFLKSNSVRDWLINEFKLKERYKKKTMIDARKALDNRVRVLIDKQAGLLTIEVRDKDPQFAADVANGHVAAMKELLGRLSLTEAHQRRTFFEQQVNQLAVRPFRDIRVQEAVLSSMIRQYEMARIDESREGPMMQQVDVAVPADKYSFPNRKFLVFSALLLGILGGVAAVLLKGFLKGQAGKSSPALTKLKRSWLPS